MGRSAPATGLKNNVRSLRTPLAMSQQRLAELAGITRQAVNAIESGRYVPNTLVGLRLASALGCRVEDLFHVEDETTLVELDRRGATATSSRMMLGNVGGVLVHWELEGSHALADGFVPADAVASGDGAAQLLVRESLVQSTAFIVGCDPSLGLLAAHVSARTDDIRAVWIPGSSRDALAALKSNRAHAAGIHLRDARTGKFNLAEARRALPRGGVVLGYTAWAQGFMVQRGNPKRIEPKVEALARPTLRFVNREPGSGSRALLDQLLVRDRVPAERVGGYDTIATTHTAIARHIADGNADVGVGLQAVAAAFNLDFLPLSDVDFDLVIPTEHLRHPAIERLLDITQEGTLRKELVTLPGYSVAELGSIRHRITAVA